MMTDEARFELSRRRIEKASVKVLRDPSRSKFVKVARDEALDMKNRSKKFSGLIVG